MSTKWLNASNFRIILGVSLIIIIAVTCIGFGYAHKVLTGYADEISRKKIDASASDTTIASLQEIERTMEENQGLIEKIQQLRSDNDFPEFAIVDQIKEIAKRNDITISSYDLNASSDEAGATTDSTQVQPQPTTEQPTTTTPSSSDVVSLTINFGSISSYKNYLQFLADIEQHVPKMRIKGAGVSGGSGGAPTDGSQQPNDPNGSGTTGGATIDPLIVEMYIK